MLCASGGGHSMLADKIPICATTPLTVRMYSMVSCENDKLISAEKYISALHSQRHHHYDHHSHAGESGEKCDQEKSINSMFGATGRERAEQKSEYLKWREHRVR